MFYAVTLGTYLVGWIATFAVTERQRRRGLAESPDWAGHHEDPFLTATKWPAIAAVWALLLAVITVGGAWRWLDEALKREGV